MKLLVRLQQLTGASKQEVIVVLMLLVLTSAAALLSYFRATTPDENIRLWLRQLDSLAHVSDSIDFGADHQYQIDGGEDNLTTITISRVQRPRKLPPSQPIDINRASKDELMKIPGIGEVMAQRIIDTRRVQAFHSVDDLLRVPGIGRKKLEQMRPYVRVETQ